MVIKKFKQIPLAAATMIIFTSNAFCLTVGLPFLNMGVGAQSQAMGGAFSAASQDASSTYWNPSALSRLESKEVFAYHNQFVDDLSYSYVAYAQPMSSKRAGFGFAFGRLAKGNLEGRNDSGARTSDFSASDNLFSASFGRKLGSSLALGLNAKFIQSKIGSTSASGAAFDVSGSYSVSPKTNLSLGLFNMGPSLVYANETTRLPSSFSAGAAHKISILTITSDFRQDLNAGKSSLSFGGQIDVAALASVRAGYVSHLAQTKVSGNNKSIDQFAGMGMGIGLKMFSRASLDYAFLPMGELGGTHHMSLSWRFR